MSNDNAFWEQQAQQNLVIASTASANAASAALAQANHASIVAANARSGEFETNREKQNLNSKISAAEDENERYRAIHARPLMDILQEITDLKLAYKEQQKLLNEWVVSQKSFRTLAYKFSEELGISDEKIKKLVNEEHSKNGKLD